MSHYFKFLPLLAITVLISCKQRTERKAASKGQSLYFIQATKYGFDTVPLTNFESPDTTFNNITTKHFNSPLGEFQVEKFTNMPNAPTDGGVELFFEKSVGVFYSRSLTWGTYSRLYTNNDTINHKIAVLLDYSMSQPELCDFPEPTAEKIGNWITPTP